MVPIVVKQSLSRSAMYEHRCLEKIKKLYKYSGKCDDQQQYKFIFEAAMVSTPRGFTDNSLMSPSQYVSLNCFGQENHSVIFDQHWTSNLRLMSAGYVLLNQSSRQSYLEVCSGSV